MWGLLIGLLFFVPVFGLAIGAGLGVLAGKLGNYSIDDNFAKQLAATMQPHSSAIFILVRRATPDKAVPELAKFGGTVLQTNLPKETEEKLQQALKEGAAEQVAQAQTVAEAQADTAAAPEASTPAPPQ